MAALPENDRAACDHELLLEAVGHTATEDKPAALEPGADARPKSGPRLGGRSFSPEIGLGICKGIFTHGRGFGLG